MTLHSMPTNESQDATPKQRKTYRSGYVLKRFTYVMLFLLMTAFLFWIICIKMPGRTYVSANQIPNQDPVPPSISEILKDHVTHLSETIGERNLQHYDELVAAEKYIHDHLKAAGYEIFRNKFQCRNFECVNVIAEIKGTESPDEIVIIGGHYDSAMGTPGANDNGSGTAATLALATYFKDIKPTKTVRFVAFTNEEPPYFQNRGEMGSWVYAEHCRKQNANIVAVLSLETMGYYTDDKGSQRYPAPLAALYPSEGNFLGFVGNIRSRQLLRRCVKTFRQHAELPSEGASLPNALPGVGWSDHWSFWQEGYVGVMVTDTAPFRYPHYHKATDTVDKIDFRRFGLAVDGLKYVIADLAGYELKSEPAAPNNATSARNKKLNKVGSQKKLGN